MRNVALLLFLASVAYAQINLATQPCQYGVLKRKEWRDMTDAEKSLYLTTFKQLQVKPRGGGLSFHEGLAQTHIDYARGIHGYAQFLPWHRYFTIVLERELQKTSGKPVTLPYWDWSKDSQAPETAPIWGDGPLTFGRGYNGGCVTTGAFAGYQSTVPNAHCLRRDWGSTLGSYVSRDVMANILSRSNTFEQMRSQLEGPHGGVHVSIGGDMSYMHSPNDPVFFLHHANVDRQWAWWQVMKPQLANTYGGAAYSNGRTVSATANDIMTPYPARVSEVYDTKRLCFVYSHKGPDGRPDNGEALVNNRGMPFPAAGDNSDVVRLVRKLQSAAPGSNMPDAEDRSDLFDLRVPRPLPDSWIQQNGLDASSVRSCEEEVKQEVVKCNTSDDFSEAVLWNDNDLLMRLLMMAAQNGPDFKLRVGKEVVEVHIDPKDGAQWLFVFRQQITQLLAMLASGRGRK